VETFPYIQAFGVERENVWRGPVFERRWKGRGVVARWVNGACADPGLMRKVQNLRADTLLIWARLDMIDRCGHLPMVEKPETFHRMLYDSLVGVEEKIPDVVKV
jgi:pimeloyl-ACP methyl ester carboxylesterase